MWTGPAGWGALGGLAQTMGEWCVCVPVQQKLIKAKERACKVCAGV